MVVSDILQQKSTLRKQVIAKRNEIDESVRVAKSQLICDQLIDMLDTHALNATKSSVLPLRIAVYQAVGSEVDLREFILAAHAKGMRICFPCIVEASFNVAKPWLKGRQMLFFEVSETDYRNRQAVFLSKPLGLCLADDERNREFLLVPPESIDMVVVPVVAFDSDNYRLGYGGGNYDGFLSQVYAAEAVRGKPAIVAGVAFIEQEVDCVPHEEHDLRLPLIITA